MSEAVKKIFKLFKDQRILSILESRDNYVVTVCDKDDPVESTIGSTFAVNKKTFKLSEFSYFINTVEYVEACNNVLYKFD